MGSDHNARVPAPSSYSISPPLSIGSSIISLRPPNDLDSDSDDFRILDERSNSPARSDSSASVLILDSTLRNSPNLAYAAARTSSPSSPGAWDEPTSGDENWQSHNGVYLWDDYDDNDVVRPPSPSSSLAGHLHALSIQGSRDTAALGGSHSRSPSTRSRSPSKHPKSPHKSPKPRKRPKSPSQRSRSSKRRGSSDRGKSLPSSPKALGGGKGKGKAQPKSRSTSPKAPRKRTKKKTKEDALEDIQGDEEDSASSKDLDTKLLALITGDEALYLRILRYEVCRHC